MFCSSNKWKHRTLIIPDSFPDFFSTTGLEFSYTEPSWDSYSGSRVTSEGGQQNILYDSNFLNGFTHSQDMFQAPTAGSISHSVGTRVLSPVSVDSSQRSPVLTHSGSGSAMIRVASQISATDSSGSSRPTRSLYSESAELRSSTSQRSHHFSSGASDITDHTFLSLPDTAYIASSPQNVENQAQSELTFHVTDDTANGYSDFSGITRSASAMDSSFFQTADSYTIASPQEIFSPVMENQADSYIGNGPAMSLGSEYYVPCGPPLVLDTFQMNSPQGYNNTDPAIWQSGYNMPGSGTSYVHNGVVNSPRSIHSSSTIEDLTPRQQHFNHDSIYAVTPEGLSPISNASQENSIEAEKLHNTYRSDPLYKIAAVREDGLFHCPFEGKDATCNHKPDKLKCNYDKFVDSHLKPYRCKHRGCESSRFSSTACQLRHEREAHALHGHGEKPFLCSFEGCDRSTVGNGFPRHWNMFDHMKRVHGYEKPATSTGDSQPAKGGRKRKADTQDLKPAKRVATTAAKVKQVSEIKQSIVEKQSQEAEKNHAQLIEGAMSLPKPDHPDFQKRLQMVARCLKNLHSVTQPTQESADAKAKSKQSG